MKRIGLNEMNYENMKHEFLASGCAVIKNFLDSNEIEDLLQECSSIVNNMNPPDQCSIFHTNRDQDRGDYFVNSGDRISFFFEKDAVDENGHLLVDRSKSLNKIGHALHWCNPAYKKVTFSNKVKNLLKNFDYKDPVIVQSMFIFKHPEIGGVVTPHQDSTFLYTEPPSAIGFWFPLVDVTLDNGCLWFIPGSHKGEIYQRYVRNPGKKPFLELKGDMPKFDEKDYVPVLVKKGDCVLIHGSVIHKSGRNLTNEPRYVYTFHAVETVDTVYSKENWLQPTEKLPFPSVFSTL